ncbi:MAG: TetR/AcrR family transcriptional regulator [Rhodococcus sp. (in: high G+C Gram-positive bacteria)]
MQVPPDRQTVTNRARRDQIVASTIEVISSAGYRAATFQSIAAHAGIKSTRTISYHFAGRDELIEAVVDSVLATVRSFMSGRSAGPFDTAGDALERAIRTTVALNSAHGSSMQALMSIFLEHHPEGGWTAYGPDEESAAMSPIEQILVNGQDVGEFTEFDTAIMAATIQRSLDGIAYLLRTHPELDLEHYADELVATFRRATRG